MNKGKSKGLSDRALHVIEGRARLTREGLKRFGSTIAFSRVGDKGKDHNFKNKTKKKKTKNKCSCKFTLRHKGAPGAPSESCLRVPNKDVVSAILHY